MHEEKNDQDQPLPPWKADPSYRTRANSPTKRPANSTCWKTVKRLSADHPLTEEGFTHICTHPGCAQPLKLTKPKGLDYWTSSKAINHLRDVHGDSVGKEYVESETANKVFESPPPLLMIKKTNLIYFQIKAKLLAEHSQAMILGSSSESAVSASSVSVLSGQATTDASSESTQPMRRGIFSAFTLTKDQRSKSAQANWVVYSRQHISFSTFRDQSFREMLMAVGDGNSTAILTEKMLKKYIEAEFQIFIMFLKFICALKMVQSFRLLGPFRCIATASIST